MEDPGFSGNGVQNEWRLVGDEAGGFTGEGCEFGFREFGFSPRSAEEVMEW